MLLMHSKSITPRLQYIVNFFSQELFEHPIRITTNKDVYLAHTGPKINYYFQEIADEEFLIAPVPILFETDIHPQEISCFEINYHKAFFQTTGDMHFDIFAASFYLISRYEEYVPHEKDEYGRYSHTNSIAFKESFLHEPLVNTWLQEFKSALLAKFPSLQFKGKQFANMVTYDVDIAYSYLNKGWIRNIGGTIKSLLNGQIKLAIERWQVLLRMKKDPYDCFEWLDALHLYCRLKPYYFFLVARQVSKYDKNNSTSSRRFRELVEYYSTTYSTGLHPSWKSGDDPSLLKEEKEWLEVVAEKEIYASRQHYLRFNIPETFRSLIKAGINKEFSMGYGTINGFRASVTSSFPWYDLERDQTTSLIMYPFCFMDANSFYERNHSPAQAYDELMKFYDAVKKVNGMLITVWHNHLLSEDKRTTGWKKMFEVFMRDTVYWDAYYDGVPA
ncbi:MAG: polysaccharide deacetylase family protein [Flavitalea sp.]